MAGWLVAGEWEDGYWRRYYSYSEVYLFCCSWTLVSVILPFIFEALHWLTYSLERAGRGSVPCSRILWQDMWLLLESKMVEMLLIQIMNKQNFAQYTSVLTDTDWVFGWSNLGPVSYRAVSRTWDTSRCNSCCQWLTSPAHQQDEYFSLSLLCFCFCVPVWCSRKEICAENFHYE